jgi:hypothetical protein
MVPYPEPEAASLRKPATMLGEASLDEPHSLVRDVTNTISCECFVNERRLSSEVVVTLLHPA